MKLEYRKALNSIEKKFKFLNIKKKNIFNFDSIQETRNIGIILKNIQTTKF